MSERDQLSILRQYDTMILLDDSGSMADYGRWEEVSTHSNAETVFVND